MAHREEITIPSSILEACQDLASLLGDLDDVVSLLACAAEGLLNDD